MTIIFPFEPEIPRLNPAIVPDPTQTNLLALLDSNGKWNKENYQPPFIYFRVLRAFRFSEKYDKGLRITREYRN